MEGFREMDITAEDLKKIEWGDEEKGFFLRKVKGKDEWQLIIRVYQSSREEVLAEGILHLFHYFPVVRDLVLTYMLIEAQKEEAIFEKAEKI